MLFKEIVDQDRRWPQWMVSDHTSSPRAFGSGELKRWHKSFLLLTWGQILQAPMYPPTLANTHFLTKPLLIPMLIGGLRILSKILQMQNWWVHESVLLSTEHCLKGSCLDKFVARVHYVGSIYNIIVHQLCWGTRAKAQSVTNTPGRRHFLIIKYFKANDSKGKI